MDYWGHRPRSGSPFARRLIVAAVVVALALLMGYLLLGRRTWMTSGRNSLVPTAEVQVLRDTYLQTEGHANRGRNFERLALAMDRQRVAGRVITEAEMVQTMGPPDLMLRDEGGHASFAYFYNRFAENDWVVYFDYRGGNLTTMGWNASAANADVHGQMGPYAPPGTTRPSTVGD